MQQSRMRVQTSLFNETVTDEEKFEQSLAAGAVVYEDLCSIQSLSQSSTSIGDNMKTKVQQYPMPYGFYEEIKKYWLLEKKQSVMTDEPSE